MKFSKAFTLSEVLLAVVIVGVIAALVLPVFINRIQTDLLNQARKREINSLENVIKGLAVTENASSFTQTMMYKETAPSQYLTTSGAFLKKYMRVSHYCGDSNGNCFASKYYTYIGNEKKEYTPDFKGACALLRNGVSICLEPQTNASPVRGTMDLNGPKGPNVLNKDLVTFELSRVMFDGDSSVLSMANEAVIIPESDAIAQPSACDTDPDGEACCKEDPSRIVSGSACCNFTDIHNENKVCWSSLRLDARYTISGNYLTWGVNIRGTDYQIDTENSFIKTKALCSGQTFKPNTRGFFKKNNWCTGTSNLMEQCQLSIILPNGETSTVFSNTGNKCDTILVISNGKDL